MLLNSSGHTYTIHDAPVLEPRIWQALRAFWRFSQRYGEYHALPPSQRRKYLQSLDNKRLR